MPSTNEFAAFYRINPATAAKGINMLVDDGMLEKRRGIGMFVVTGARERLIQLRRKEFAEQYIDPLLAEARRLGIDADELVDMIRQAAGSSQEHPHSIIDPHRKKARRHDRHCCRRPCTRRYRGATALDDVRLHSRKAPSPVCWAATAPASPP